MIRSRADRVLGALVPAVPFLWLALFFLLPFLIVLRISLSDPITAQPPYAPQLDWSSGFDGWRDFLEALDFETFQTLFEDDLYWRSALSSLRISAVATILLLVIGYPVAYAMARAPSRWQPVLVALVVVPFWTSFLIRVYAWIAILKPEGLLNHALQGLGLIDRPLALLDTEATVVFGLVYAYLPFIILPLYAVLHRLDPELIEAARDLGASPMRAFWTIVVPQSQRGVLAGALLCFIPMIGEFVVPDLLGGSDTLMIGRVLWAEFFQNRDWPLAAAVAIMLLALIAGPIVVLREAEARRFERAS